MRGKASKNGDTMVSVNGYHYTKVGGRWRLTHHIVAEEEILGRPLNANERVIFIDKDRTNLKVDNIRVVVKGKQTLQRRLAQLEARKNELQAEINAVKVEIAKHQVPEQIDKLEERITELNSALST